jgi:hypothetical protein
MLSTRLCFIKRYEYTKLVLGNLFSEWCHFNTSCHEKCSASFPVIRELYDCVIVGFGNSARLESPFWHFSSNILTLLAPMDIFWLCFGNRKQHFNPYWCFQMSDSTVVIL